MKKLLFFTLCVAVFSCESKKDNAGTSTATNSTPTTAVTTEASSTPEVTTPASTVTSTKIETAKTATSKSVDYYYQTLANVDSEDPSIGVGPRTILSVDKAKGILRYKENSSTEEKTIQVWNKNGYDVINFSAGVFVSINGGEPIPLYNIKNANKIIKEEVNKRSARGGECNYFEEAAYQVSATGIMEIFIRCSDDDAFKDIMGTVEVVNGKLEAKKK